MPNLMGRLYDSAMTWTKAMTRKRSKPASAPGRMMGGSPSSWRPWSGDPYQQCVEYRNWVYTAVRFRGIKRQTAPMVARVAKPGEKEKYFTERRKSFKGLCQTPDKRRWVTKSVHTAAVRGGSELEFLDADSPAMQLLHNPNDPQIGQDLWFLASIMEDLTGRAHIWKVRNGRGEVVELWLIPTPWVDPVPFGDALIGYYRVSMPNGGTETIDADDMITIGEPSPFGYLAWCSPTQSHGLNIDLFNALIVSRFNALVNGANVGTMISIPSSMANNPESMARFENSLLARTVGTINFGRPLIAEIMSDGTQPLLTNLTPQLELAFQKSAVEMRNDIFAAYDLDASVLGYAAETTYAGAVVTDRNVYKKCVKPYWERRNATLTEKLLIPDFGADLVAINEYKPEETPEEKIKRIDLQAKYGAISVNEIRVEFEQEPYEDPIYDEPLITSNQAKMDDHGAENDPGGYDITPPGGKAVEGRTRRAKDFDESKHPRGQPDNAGKFGPGAGQHQTQEPLILKKNGLSHFDVKGHQGDSIEEILAEGASSAPNLSPSVVANRYQMALEVMKSMPDNAIEHLDKTVKTFTSCSGLGDVGSFFEYTTSQTLESDEVIGGIWYAKTGRIVMDGGYEDEDLEDEEKRSSFKGILAHELGHALDTVGGRPEYSSSSVFSDCFDRELSNGQLTQYASTSPDEAFAEFARYIYTDPSAAKDLDTRFPRTATYFRSLGYL
jgi:phage portal protein BeeE